MNRDIDFFQGGYKVRHRQASWRHINPTNLDLFRYFQHIAHMVSVGMGQDQTINPVHAPTMQIRDRVRSAFACEDRSCQASLATKSTRPPTSIRTVRPRISRKRCCPLPDVHHRHLVFQRVFGREK